MITSCSAVEKPWIQSELDKMGSEDGKQLLLRLRPSEFMIALDADPEGRTRPKSRSQKTEGSE
jgi:hypothetical protein